MGKVDEEVLRDLWLKKYFNTSTKELIETHSKEYCQGNWFADYKVTKEQYEEWVSEAKKFIKKETKCSDTYLKQQFPWIDLQVGPSVIQEDSKI